MPGPSDIAVEDCDSESDLSPDPFLEAIDSGLFNLETALDPKLPDSYNVTVQTEMNSMSVEEIIKNYLKNELRINVKMLTSRHDS